MCGTQFFLHIDYCGMEYIYILTLIHTEEHEKCQHSWNYYPQFGSCRDNITLGVGSLTSDAHSEFAPWAMGHVSPMASERHSACSRGASGWARPYGALQVSPSLRAPGRPGLGYRDCSLTMHRQAGRLAAVEAVYICGIARLAHAFFLIIFYFS